jgi:hypothetical protein
MQCSAPRFELDVVIAGQVLKARRRQKITDLFVDLPNYALKERLSILAVTTEETYLARLHNSGNVIPLLKQKTSLRINDDSACDLAIRQCVHRTDLMAAGGGSVRTYSGWDTVAGFAILYRERKMPHFQLNPLTAQKC